jgi:hypothetical protein
MLGVVIASPAVRPRDVPKMLSQKGKGVSALKAVMSITSKYDREKSVQNIKGFVLYRRPLDFRFQGMGPAGNSLFELVFKTTGFELYIPSDGKILKGDKRCFARRFPDVAELQYLIPLALLQWRDVQFENAVAINRNDTVIKMAFRGESWEATLDNEKLHVKRLVRLNNAGPDLIADFADFGSGDYGWLPRSFRLRSRSGGWRTTVKMQKIKVNPFLVEKNFKLEPMYSPRIEQCR